MQQANLVVEQAGPSAEEATIQMYSEIGKTQESYLSSGVELIGSSLDQINQIRITQAGKVQAQYYQAQADIAQTRGLAAVLSAQGQNQLTDQQNKLSQAQQENARLNSILNPIAGLGIHALMGALDPPTGLNGAAPATP